MSNGQADMDALLEGNFEGQAVTLAGIAGINMDEVEEYVLEFPQTPTGFYALRAKAGEITAINKKPCAKFTCIIEQAQLPEGAEDDPQTLIGKEHDELMFIGQSPLTTPKQDVGIIKKFMIDTGFTGSGLLGDLVNNWGSSGARFMCMVKKTASKNDPDKKYSNIEKDKVKPYVVEAQPTQAPAAATEQAPATAPEQQKQQPAQPAGGFRL